MVKMANEEIPRGPEDMPLRSIVTEFYIMVTLIDIKSNRKIRVEKINYGNAEARRWLGKCTYYALTHGYRVETCAESDYVVEL